ncbi:motility associated factor glycosyltransferase family protein [Zavarzinia sp.]|uniref:motility associated factor glycosyltransferase family protein n=1 Tax=Zavarzinia sp. TaxID=2027920 RepID=UPI003BB629FC
MNPGFAERFPAVARSLPATTLSTIVRDETGRAIDIDLGRGRVYNGDAEALAAEQVGRFEVKPLQFFTQDLSGANIGSEVSARMRDRMLEGMAENGITSYSNKPDYEGSFLVILGLGLGYHLRPLIETTKARHVLIVEPVPEFTAHAAATQDWQALFEIADRRGIDIKLSSAAQPDQIIAEIRRLVYRIGEPFIDGAFVFVHYPSWVLTETRDRLQQVIDQMFISKGFYEDELKMMTNAVGNLLRYDSRLIDAKPKPARPETAIIIGSGPSIDRSMDDLRRLVPQGVVFSAGTSLRVCLRNGIRPQFHCELENGDPTVEVLTALSREFDLSGITLIASVTVDPRVAALFDEVYFFFRDSVSSTRILAPERHELIGVGPTCVNTALRVSAALGFTDYILFGTDCGSKLGQVKHSRDSVYAVTDKYKTFERNLKYNQTLPGNFGGIVECDWILALCAQILGDITRRYKLNVLNTSDGALLNGVMPRVASSIRNLPRQADAGKVRADMRQLARACPAGSFFERWEPGQLLEGATAFYDDLLALVDETIAQGEDLVAFWHRLSDFMDGFKDQYARTESIAHGSIRSMPKIGMYFSHRMTDPERRAMMMATFLAEYRSTVLFMRDGTLGLIADLETALAERSAHRLRMGVEA